MTKFIHTAYGAFRAIVVGKIWAEDVNSGTIYAFDPEDDAGDGVKVIDHAIAGDPVNEWRYVAMVLPQQAAVAKEWSDKTEALYTTVAQLSDDYLPDPFSPHSGVDDTRVKDLAAKAGVSVEQAIALLHALAEDINDRAHQRRELTSTEAGCEAASAAFAACLERIKQAVLTAAPDSPRAERIREEE